MPLPAIDTVAAMFKAQLTASGLVGATYVSPTAGAIDVQYLLCKSLAMVWAETLTTSIGNTIWSCTGVPSAPVPLAGTTLTASPATVASAVGLALAPTSGLPATIATSNQIVGVYGPKLPEALRMGSLMAIQSVGIQVVSPLFPSFSSGFFNAQFVLPSAASLVLKLIQLWDATPGLADGAGSPTRVQTANVMLEAVLLPLLAVHPTVSPVNVTPAPFVVPPLFALPSGPPTLTTIV
jgi:hypothetical protein